MPIQHQWDYLFAIATLFAALDAFNIGANDVANSFATSVSSRSLTLRQACVAAAIFEFLGAVLVGARVAETIKSNIIESSAFKGNAGVQMLGFTCALVCSATWLMIATHQSWPVSTTYSIVSAVAGVGVAMAGPKSVNWGWGNGSGLGAIFSGFIIAPGLAAAFAAAVYLITKYCVFKRSRPTMMGLYTSPIFFFSVTAIITMSIVYKGAPQLNLDELAPATIAAAIVGTSAVVTVLAALFWLPFVYAKVVKHDYTIRWYHFFMGPLLWKRPPPKDAGKEGAPSAVRDYRVVREDRPVTLRSIPEDVEMSQASFDDRSSRKTAELRMGEDQRLQHHEEPPSKYPGPDIDGPWIEPRHLWIIFRYRLPFVLKKMATHGTSVDVVEMQANENQRMAARLHDMHSRATQYDNETEHLYSFIQVMTACTASFAHGSNDVANAIGPYTVVYNIWRSGQLVNRRSEIPIWILVFGGAMIVIGLATYGYNIMRVIGNRLTLHSPSRGFSMELGSAITVILASNFGIPVSTTMCITGATLGVGLCNGDYRAFNWWGLGWIFIGWVLTVPVVGLAAGCLMGIILNAPNW